MKMNLNLNRVYIYIYILGGSELNLVTINLQLWVVKGETVQI